MQNMTKEYNYYKYIDNLTEGGQEKDVDVNNFIMSEVGKTKGKIN